MPRRVEVSAQEPAPPSAAQLRQLRAICKAPEFEREALELRYWTERQRIAQRQPPAALRAWLQRQAKAMAVIEAQAVGLLNPSADWPPTARALLEAAVRPERAASDPDPLAESRSHLRVPAALPARVRAAEAHAWALEWRLVFERAIKNLPTRGPGRRGSAQGHRAIDLQTRALARRFKLDAARTDALRRFVFPGRALATVKGRG
jgi:hypothetical protein